MEDIKIVEQRKRLKCLYVTIRDTFHARARVCVCMCELEKTACCDTCMYFIVVETFGFDALVSNIVNIEKKKKKEEEIWKEEYVYFQDFRNIFPKYVLKL